MRKNELPEDILIVGDKVDIVSEDGQVYRSMVEDRVDDGPFLVSVPHRKGRYMYVAQDDVIYLVFYREGGRYIVEMKVLALEKRGEIRYMWLMQLSKAQRNQRREAYRLPVTIGIVVYEHDDEYKPEFDLPDEKLSISEVVASRDLSTKGLAISSKNKYNVSDMHLLGIDFEDTSEIIGGVVRVKKAPQLILKAEVRRCIPMNENKINHIGFQFLDLTKAVNEKIARYVLVEQQRQIKNKRGRS